MLNQTLRSAITEKSSFNLLSATTANRKRRLEKVQPTATAVANGTQYLFSTVANIFFQQWPTGEGRTGQRCFNFVLAYGLLKKKKRPPNFVSHLRRKMLRAQSRVLHCANQPRGVSWENRFCLSTLRPRNSATAQQALHALVSTLSPKFSDY